MTALAEHGETSEQLMPIAIETGRGLLVAGLQASGRNVYVIDSMVAARYRESTTVARSKSDASPCKLGNRWGQTTSRTQPVPAGALPLHRD